MELFRSCIYLIISLPANVLFCLIILNITCAIYTWRNRSPGREYFTLLMAAITIWTATNIGQWISDSPVIQIAFARLKYIGTTSIPVLWLLFITQYTRKTNWLNHRWIGLLSVRPAIIHGLVFANDRHGLIWPSNKVTSTLSGGWF